MTLKGTKTALISGATGMIGSAVARALRYESRQDSWLVRTLSRRKGDDGCFEWNPRQKVLDHSAFDKLDLVIHLAGANISAKRWSESYKTEIRESRVNGAQTLVDAIRAVPCPPSVFMCASAIGYYGDRREEVLTENSPRGTGFLADVAAEVESIASSLQSERTRVLFLRFGVVLSPTGGALAKLIPIFRLGLGGTLGLGSQYFSWISLSDAVRAILWLVEQGDISGPVNITSPSPITNAEFTYALAAYLHRPAIWRIPSWALRIALGQMADEALLASCRVKPALLLSQGFTFQQPTIDLARILHQTS